MDEELRFHVERQTADLIRSGMAPAEASRRARVEFGAIEARKEEMREALGLRLLDEVHGDLRYAVRQLRHSPGFTAVAVLSLALGIGANTAIFSLINTLFLRMLPVREPERLVQLFSRYPGEPRLLGFSWRHYQDYRDRNHVFSDLTGISHATRFQLSGRELPAETVSGQYVPGNFFQALGVKAAVGGSSIRKTIGSVLMPRSPWSAGRTGRADSIWIPRFWAGKSCWIAHRPR